MQELFPIKRSGSGVTLQNNEDKKVDLEGVYILLLIPILKQVF